MKYKTLFLSICLFFSVSFTGFFYSANLTEGRSIISQADSGMQDCENYRVRVFSNGSWWIYLYDCHGNLIGIYADPDE